MPRRASSETVAIRAVSSRPSLRRREKRGGQRLRSEEESQAAGARPGSCSGREPGVSGTGDRPCRRRRRNDSPSEPALRSDTSGLLFRLLSALCDELSSRRRSESSEDSDDLQVPEPDPEPLESWLDLREKRPDDMLLASRESSCLVVRRPSESPPSEAGLWGGVGVGVGAGRELRSDAGVYQERDEPTRGAGLGGAS